MRFLGQVVLDAHLFGELAGRVAYLFITDGEIFVDNTFDSEGGENALIVQPGAYDGPTEELLSGPSLYKMISDLTGERLIPVSCEFAVEYSAGEDPQILVAPPFWLSIPPPQNLTELTIREPLPRKTA